MVITTPVTNHNPPNSRKKGKIKKKTQTQKRNTPQQKVVCFPAIQSVEKTDRVKKLLPEITTQKKFSHRKRKKYSPAVYTKKTWDCSAYSYTNRNGKLVEVPAKKCHRRKKSSSTNSVILKPKPERVKK